MVKRFFFFFESYMLLLTIILYLFEKICGTIFLCLFYIRDLIKIREEFLFVEIFDGKDILFDISNIA